MNKNKIDNNTKSNMKNFVIFLTLIIMCFAPFNIKRSGCANAQEEKKGKLAIVIDDFGEDRRGVEEMLNIDAPLTIAVLPAGEFTAQDAETAHQKGHEVILHMPMENLNPMPESYYGSLVIRNSFSPEDAVNALKEGIEKVPHCVGVNIHMGTGVSKNEKLITAIMEETKKQGKYFLDSKTVVGSVCDDCAEKTGVKYFSRDVFLEPSGTPSEEIATKYLIEAGELAIKNGKAVAIGHVGPVGMEKTAKSIEKCLQHLEIMGVELVTLSEL